MAAPVAAAPLDGLLTAMPERLAPSGFVEFATDHMNDSLDVFRIRESDPLTAGTKAGDYRGQHVNAGWNAGQGLWLSGLLVPWVVDTCPWGRLLLQVVCVCWWQLVHGLVVVGLP